MTKKFTACLGSNVFPHKLASIVNMKDYGRQRARPQIFLRHFVHAHLNPRGLQILITRMRTQYIPGSFSSAPKEPGYEATVTCNGQEPVEVPSRLPKRDLFRGFAARSAEGSGELQKVFRLLESCVSLSPAEQPAGLPVRSVLRATVRLRLHVPALHQREEVRQTICSLPHIPSHSSHPHKH